MKFKELVELANGLGANVTREKDGSSFVYTLYQYKLWPATDGKRYYNGRGPMRLIEAELASLASDKMRFVLGRLSDTWFQFDREKSLRQMRARETQSPRSKVSCEWTVGKDTASDK